MDYDDVEVTVCLEHGSFVPCRKRGEHRLSSSAGDIAMVRYHQEVSVRLQQRPQPPPPPPPVYRQVGTPAEDWPLYISDDYSSYTQACNGSVMDEQAQGGQHYLKPCTDTFSASTPGELLEEVRHHIAAVVHYEPVIGG